MATDKKLRTLGSLASRPWPKDTRIVLTNGCFDILHRGHVEYLENAANCGDFLIVAINSDQAVRKLKGPTRPVNSEQDRARVLAGLVSVDLVAVFDDVDVVKLLDAIKPAVWAKGGDYTLETLNTAEVEMARKVGAEIKLIPMVSGYSTTSTIKALSR